MKNILFFICETKYLYICLIYTFTLVKDFVVDDWHIYKLPKNFNGYWKLSFAYPIIAHAILFPACPVVRLSLDPPKPQSS